jgi:glycosyltransferase involved in cell wall biosynthesis
VIPALDEEASIGDVVRAFTQALTALERAPHVIVADNGSTDETSHQARQAGAHVVYEPVRGYGRACLRALASAPTDAELFVFADGDGSDDPADLPTLLAPIDVGIADLVIGSRASGIRRGWVERGALTPAQRFGNALSSRILRTAYGQPTTDLGPFRAVRAEALARLRMDDLDFGWTVQMQACAARVGLRVTEVPVHYRRRRTGRSKVSGDLRASAAAGRIILSTLWRERRFR